MNFDFSDEQKELSSHLRKMLMSKCSLKEARRCLEQEQSYSHEVWSQLAKMGLLGTAIPTSYGGAGAGYLELCLVAEELGRVLAPVPSVSTIYLATELIKEVASSEQREKLLPEIANGSLIFVVAICDADSGEPAYFNKERGTLSGLKAPVEDSLMADHAIVYAKSQEGDSLVLIDLQDTTVASTGSRSIDPTKPQGKLHFHDTPGEPLGRLGGGTNALQRARDRAAILLAFEQLGAADRALEISIEYATQRKAFGRLIGSYQAIKHKLANVYVQNQLARVHAYFGAWAMQTGDADLRSAAGTARIAAINAFQFAAQEMLQVHGGIGFTWESDCQLFYRRAQHTALSLGAASSWRAQVVEKLRRD